MGASKPDAIAKKVAKMVRDAKLGSGWTKQTATGWYSTVPAEQLAEYTAQEQARAEEKLRVFSNTAVVDQVVAFRQAWQPTFDTLAYAKKQMKTWNRERREAKKAA